LKTSDEQILARLLVASQGGDRKAYEEFLVQASECLRIYLRKRMETEEMLEDVLQDALLAIHRARHTYLPDRPVGPWLYAIAGNRMIDFYRRFRRVEKNESTHDVLDDAAWDKQAVPTVSDKYDQDIQVLLAQLPEKQRRVIELLKLEELSVRAVAEKMSMSESAVKVTAFRGYETLRRFLGVVRK
jgi:RNA polymerase sigma-70 factor (ECF subfamily)